jgi:DNA polymerase III gamma/tau subunit
VDELVRNGHDLREFVGGLVEHFRNLLVVQATGSAAQVEVSDVQRARYQEVAQRFTTPDLLRYQRFLAATEGALRWSVQPRFRVEADMVQLTLLPTAPEVGDLVARIEEWTQKGAGPAAVSPAPTGERTAPSVAPAQRPAPPPRVATTPPPPVEHTPRETPKIAIEEVRSRWEEFLALVSSKRISVGSRLSGAQPVSVSGITVHVGCVDAFQVETVQRNRDFLQTVFEEVFGARARLEADVRPGAEHPTGTTGASRTAKPSEDHPMIAAIKRELGAEPLDEGE